MLRRAFGGEVAQFLSLWLIEPSAAAEVTLMSWKFLKSRRLWVWRGVVELG